jgi:uncharacterized protein YggL (DUF469 family)
MNRRIRKKKMMGEFDWKGFLVRCTFEPPLQDQEANAFFDDYIAFCEQHGLMTGGGMTGATLGQFVTKSRRGRRIGRTSWRHAMMHCTDADRALVREYLAGRPETHTLEIKPLVGTAHGLAHAYE